MNGVPLRCAEARPRRGDPIERTPHLLARAAASRELRVHDMSRQTVISFFPEENYQISNFFGAESVRFSQILFGKTAQIIAYMKAVDHADIIFCHRPEIISGAQSRHYYSMAGAAPHVINWDEVIHLRFDAPRNVRLLRGADNHVMTCYAPTRETAPLSAAARIIDYYPAGTKQLHTYRGHDICRHVLPIGDELPVHVLDENDEGAELAEASGSFKNEVETVRHLLRIGAIRAISFAEFLDPETISRGATYPIHQHSDFEAALTRIATRRSVKQIDAGTDAFTLIPFNLDDDGATLENLIATIAAHGLTGSPQLTTCVAPFNANLLNCNRIRRLVQRCAQACNSHGPLRNLFLFFPRDAAATPLLNRLFKAAVIDGSDPEGTWNGKRLHRAGVPIVVLTNASNTQRWKEAPFPVKAFKAGCQVASEIEDWYGKRVVVSDAISAKETSALTSMIAALSSERLVAA